MKSKLSNKYYVLNQEYSSLNFGKQLNVKLYNELLDAEAKAFEKLMGSKMFVRNCERHKNETKL